MRPGVVIQRTAFMVMPMSDGIPNDNMPKVHGHEGAVDERTVVPEHPWGFRTISMGTFADFVAPGNSGKRPVERPREFPRSSPDFEDA